MAEIKFEGEICADCAQWVANMDLTSLDYYYPDETEALFQYNRITTAVRLFEEEWGNIVLSCTEEKCGVDAHTNHGPFKKCDVCDAHLYRYHCFVTLVEEERNA